MPPASNPATHRKPGHFRSWILATRPATLAAAVVPVLVGTAIAHSAQGLRVGPAVGALVGALLLQILANLSNDVFDYQKGADTADRLGPTRVVQAGLLQPRQVWVGIVVVIALALGVGGYLASVAGPGVVAIGVASLVAAMAYTGGPYPLGYNGLGEIFVFLFFGFVAVLGTVWVQAGSVPGLAWGAATAIGALSSAILVVNNIRDVDTDAVAGKRTLAVRFGRRWAVAEYILLITLPYLLSAVLFFAGGGRSGIFLPLLTLPLAVRVGLRVLRSPPGKPGGAALNVALVQTAQLLLAYGVLLAAGVAVWR